MNGSEDKTILINESDIICLQLDNARYYWITESHQFYFEKGIRVIDLPSYLPDLDPIENIWSIMKCKIRGIKFITKNSLKNYLYWIWSGLELRIIKAT